MNLQAFKFHLYTVGYWDRKTSFSYNGFSRGANWQNECEPVCLGADPRVVVNRAPTNRRLSKVTNSSTTGLLCSTCCCCWPEVTCTSGPLHSIAIVHSILSKTEPKLKVPVSPAEYLVPIILSGDQYKLLLIRGNFQRDRKTEQEYPTMESIVLYDLFISFCSRNYVLYSDFLNLLQKGHPLMKKVMLSL
jgi:hypothetical protein